MNQWCQRYSVSTSYGEWSSVHSSGGKRGTAGHSWLALKCKKKPIQPSIGPSTWCFIMREMAENDPFMMAHIMHCLTNHTPTGEYHRWFFPDQPTHCPHCTDHIYHTRSHILASCGEYASPFTSTQMIYSDKNSARLKTLLKKNPTAFTFEDLPPNPPWTPYHTLAPTSNLSDTTTIWPQATCHTYKLPQKWYIYYITYNRAQYTHFYSKKKGMCTSTFYSWMDPGPSHLQKHIPWVHHDLDSPLQGQPLFCCW